MTFQLVTALVTHVGVTPPDEFDCEVVQLLEVVGAVCDLVGLIACNDNVQSHKPWK